MYNFKILFVIIFLFVPLASASAKDTSGLTVKLLSVWASDGGVLVQTEPKHSIEGLNCTDNYWLQLSKQAVGYDAILSMLLSAQVTQAKVTVRAGDSGKKFCVLERVILTY